eukprot:7160643-Pyramimonas_sp.AAC.1
MALNWAMSYDGKRGTWATIGLYKTSRSRTSLSGAVTMRRCRMARQPFVLGYTGGRQHWFSSDKRTSDHAQGELRSSMTIAPLPLSIRVAACALRCQNTRR